MSAEGAGRGMPARRARGARADTQTRVEVGLRVAQGAVALWLLVSAVVLEGPHLLVTLKDVLAGGVLLSVTIAAAARSAARRLESATCLVLGALLIVASVLLEFGAGPEAVTRQWNEVVVGVLLVCLGAARAR